MADNALQSAKTVAGVLDLTERQVNNLVKEGVLEPAKRNPNRYDLLATVRAYIRYLRKRAEGGHTSEEVIGLQAEKLREDVRLKAARAEQEELKAAELRGRMHRSEDVAAMTDDLVWAVRGRILAIPGRVARDAAEAATPAEAAEAVKKECIKALDDLSSYSYDPEKYRERVRERTGIGAGRDSDGGIPGGDGDQETE